MTQAATQIFTKPPPPPPTRAIVPQRVNAVTRYHQLAHYLLPMHDQYQPAWVEILNRCGYPLDVVVIDFETYFDDSYGMGSSESALSTIEYVQDKRFEILGCAFTPMDGLTPFTDYEYHTQFQIGEKNVASFLKYLQNEYGPNLEHCTVVMQNAQFDAAILSRKFNIHPPHLIDVLGLARHWNSRQKHGLDTLAKQFELPLKGDTEQFSGCTFRKRMFIPKSRKRGPKMPVQRPLMTDEQVTALSTYASNDAMREWELFTLLLPRLSNPQRELQIMQHTLELFTKPVLRVDFAKGEELIQQFREQINQALEVVGATAEEISGTISFERLLLNALEAVQDHPQKYYKVGKSGYILALAQDDPETELLLHHSSERVRNLMLARQAVKSWPLHIKRVERIMRMAKADGGRLPVPLKYCGAHTGRWSGGEKINLQNLPKDGLVALIRHLLIAPEGNILVIADASAIEARVLAWIAGQWDLVDRFAAGEEIYCGFASKVLGRPIRKPRNTDLPAVAERLKWARNAIGKVGILGCGYGMGAAKIVDYAGGAVDADMAERIKTTYRTENKIIVQFWRDVEKAFLYTAKYQRPTVMPRGLRFDSTSDCDVMITLPNGRELKYVRVKVVPDDRCDKLEVYNELEHKWEHLWGGTITENIVQAISRDVLIEAGLRCEEQGQHIALHVHDELVGVAPVEEGDAALKAAIAELSRVPDWAPRMPLNAEGYLSERYKK
jgi:DNA polymerase